jgi:uncharacterized protein (TIRG00374 family)
MMTTGAPAPRRGKLPSWLPKVAGYSISAVCLIWVLHDYKLGELIPAIRSLEWKWVALAVATDLLVYVVHGWRWNVLLAPVARLKLWRSVQSIYIGLFANEVLPLRVGEVIRCYLMAHWNNLHLSVVFASAALERVIDGFWLVLAFLITATFVRAIPGELTLLVQIVGGALIVCTGILLWIVFHKHHAHSVIRESRWATALRHVIEGLHMMGNARTLSQTAAVSLIYLVLQFVTVYALMMARGYDFSIWVAAGVVTIVRLGTVVPSAPGNLGVFQAVCTLALQLFELEATEAVTFSFVMFFALTLPLLIGGAIAVALTGLNIGELRKRAELGIEASRREPAPENR